MPVVDASVVVDWVAPDADPDGPAIQALERMVSSGVAVVAPPLMWQEVANALLTGVRRRRWNGAAADAAFELLDGLPVIRADHVDDLHSAWNLSRRHDEHPLYDLVYVAVALRLHDRLVTADDRLLARLAGTGAVVRPDDWR